METRLYKPHTHVLSRTLTKTPLFWENQNTSMPKLYISNIELKIPQLHHTSRKPYITPVTNYNQKLFLTKR